MTNQVNDDKKAFTSASVNVADVMKLFGYSIEQGLEQELIEAQDMVEPMGAVKRKALARMAHMYLRKVLDEPDCDIWQPAHQLRDLFDCRTCVNHVAQVYVKGIMPGVEKDLFGMEQEATAEELALVWRRLQDSAMRDFSYLPSGISSSGSGHSGTNADVYDGDAMTEDKLIHITCAEAIRMREEGTIRLIDVRSPEEYEEYHLPGAELFPLNDILDNPLIVGGNPAEPMLVGCRSGRRSETAACKLAENGYERLYYFGLEN